MHLQTHCFFKDELNGAMLTPVVQLSPQGPLAEMSRSRSPFPQFFKSYRTALSPSPAPVSIILSGSSILSVSVPRGGGGDGTPWGEMRVDSHPLYVSHAGVEGLPRAGAGPLGLRQPLCPRARAPGHHPQGPRATLRGDAAPLGRQTDLHWRFTSAPSERAPLGKRASF